jgi:RNA polymerase sigma-70 factor (ECF subfamily)
MGTADAARAGRRKNLSLRRGPRARRQKQTFDAAFETFYREHVADVYQYALAVLGSSPDAEDVTQQTFLNAYRAFERGERPRKPHNWLIKIAHNVCRMRWRQLGRRPQEVPLESAGEPASPEDDTPSLDEVLTELARLPFNQRAAIVMREVEGRSYAEIAEVLATTVPAVEALLFRARGNLRARRSALSGALSIAPVPAGLGSFIGGGSGGLVAGGGAILGSQLALKAAAVVATSVIAGGLGFKAVDAVATPDRQAAVPRLHEQTRHVVGPVRQRHAGAAVRRTVDVAGFRQSRPAVSRHGALRQVPTNDLPSASDATSPNTSSATDPSAPVAEAPAAPTVSTDPVDKIVASVPEPPAVPATTVAVETPVVAVTVTAPPVQLPPPPLK